MRFDRKFYMVTMAIFAVFLFTTEVFAGMTATVVGGGGTVDPTSAKNDATITIEPISGYQVDKIILYEGVNNLQLRGSVFEYCGSEDDKITCSVTYDGLNVKFSYEKLNASYVLEASFEEIPTFTYTASNTSAGPYGVITGPEDVTLYQEESHDFTVYEGSDTTFAITPNEFCQVVDVFVDDISIGAVPSYTFDGTSDHTITASFEPIPVFAEFTTTASGSGEITTDDAVTFTDASEGDLTYWKWFINNELISEAQTPLVHTFTQTGNYTVALEVGNTAAVSTYYATFTVTLSNSASPVAHESSGQGYGSLPEAYRDIIDGSIETILIKTSMPIEENLDFGRNVTVILKGGYDDDFQPNNGFSRIHGNVIISDGKVKVSKVIIGSLN